MRCDPYGVQELPCFPLKQTIDKAILKEFFFIFFWNYCDLSTQNVNLSLFAISQNFLSKFGRVFWIRAKRLRHNFIVAPIFPMLFLHLSLDNAHRLAIWIVQSKSIPNLMICFSISNTKRCKTTIRASSPTLELQPP